MPTSPSPSPSLDFEPESESKPSDPTSDEFAWRQSVDDLLRTTDSFSRGGLLDSVEGATLRARGVTASIGELCELRIGTCHSLRKVGLAEVIGVRGPELILSSLNATIALSSRIQVVPLGRCLTVPVGEVLLGRVLNGFGQPIDELGEIDGAATRPLEALSPAALQRQSISRPLITGIRAVDALLACGQGQRMAIFSPAGAGKSALIGALARQCKADVVVLALVGERGREVGDFVREQLGAPFMRRTVVLASTSDKSAIERSKCALAATTIAEHFRSQGKHVLLLVDSLTRLVRAQHELAQAAGLSASSGAAPFPAYSTLASLLERAGTGSQGAISAFYTVLVQEPLGTDPIAEEIRSLVDGHLVLSRTLADVGHFPAIDVLRSFSRVMPRLASPRHSVLARQLRALLAKLESIELLVQVGEYRAGSDALADHALALQPAVEKFLRQTTSLNPPDPDEPIATYELGNLNAIQATLESLLQQ